jgi:hypothetical protein
MTKKPVVSNQLLERIGAVLAFIIGAMAVLAGGRVLLGNLPDYYVIDWLPVYNFFLGLLSVFVTALLIWRRSQYAMPFAIVTFSAHALVLIILQTAYRQVVAPDSLAAMTIRLVVWSIILALLFFASRKRTIEI